MLQSQREVAAGGDPLSQGGGHTRVEDPSRPGGGISCMFVVHVILVQWQPLCLASHPGLPCPDFISHPWRKDAQLPR